MSLTTDKPQAMPILEDVADQSGVAIAKGLAGETHVGKNAVPSLVGIDAAGNLQYLKVNAQGELVVNTESEEVACLSASAKVAGGTSEQQILEITLIAGREYREIGWSVSNFRQSEYRIIHVDDPSGTPVEEELFTCLVGPGDYNCSGELDCLTFMAGATSPVLRLVGQSKDVASDLRGTVSVKEVV